MLNSSYIFFKWGLGATYNRYYPIEVLYGEYHLTRVALSMLPFHHLIISIQSIISAKIKNALQAPRRLYSQSRAI